MDVSNEKRLYYRVRGCFYYCIGCSLYGDLMIEKLSERTRVPGRLGTLQEARDEKKCR